MCSIIGFYDTAPSSERGEFLKAFPAFLRLGRLRGRDGFGYLAVTANGKAERRAYLPPSEPSKLTVDYDGILESLPSRLGAIQALISNHRAEPTTEFVREKSEADQQPYRLQNWAVVHNGMIANDKQILRDTGVWPPPGHGVDSWAVPAILSHSRARTKCDVHECLQQLRGAMALGMLRLEEPPELFLYRDFTPLYLWWLPHHRAFVFSSIADSARECFGWDSAEIYVPPYTLVYGFSPNGTCSFLRTDRTNADRAIVICSGGLDSTTAAKIATMECREVTLLHFLYGCQAEEREKEAIANIARELQCRYEFIDMGWLKALGGSPLLEAEGRISGGVEGAEFAHEWVHARNTAMIGVAAAWCDRYDIGKMYLGLNLEEAGAYPDNTTEFYRLFDRVLDCGTRSRPRILNPCANLTKKEIVELALRIGAPIQHSWSCYRGGPVHCGRCGPCFMRRTAFRMLGREDMIPYAE